MPGRRLGVLLLVAVLAAGCGANRIKDQSEGHIGRDDPRADESSRQEIPEPVTRSPSLPPPEVEPPQETYTVMVNEVPVKELLFALARDAQLNLDIHDDIEGVVTINAIDQTLPRILDRIARQTDIRYRLEDNSLVVSADTPFLRTYKVPYVNMSRDSVGRIDLSTQIASAGTADIGSGGGRGGGRGGNNSSLSVTNNSSNEFWGTLFANINSIIGGGEPRQQSRGEDLTNARVAVNRESGLVSVRATSKQHADVQEFLDQVIASAQRQVLIEATVVEINLSNRYQTGVDWSRLTTDMISAELPDGVDVEQQTLSSNLSSPPNMVLTYGDMDEDNVISASVRLLERFGDVQVLSSPKVMALNNQTSVLKVVDNRVYFTVDVQTTGLTDSNAQTTFETEVHTVPVGLVMSLVPYIAENSEVMLNIRPTITRILQFVNDPNPELVDRGVTSPIPEIQVREMESVLRLNDGQIAVIGGLMQDSTSKNSDGVPLLSRIPFLGEAFKYRDDQVEKTELVIFLRTRAIHEPSLDGDLENFRQYLPESRGARSAAGS
jgi:general secretion pathway protein D